MGKATIREYHPLKRRHTTLVNLSAPPYRHPERSPRSLLHCRHRHTCALTQTTPWCFLFRLSLAHGLPVCKKDPSTSALMTGGRRIASHSFSHRCIELCLFEALYPAPLGTLFPSRESAVLVFLMSFRIAAECQAALPEVFLFADVAFDRPAIEESTDIEE